MKRAEHAQHRVERELGRRGDGESGDVEDRLAAVKKSVDREGHDGREDARDDGLEFEGLLAVEHFRREKGGPERGLEDGADPSRRPGKEHRAALPVVHLQDRRQERPEARADLGNGALLSRRSSRAYGDSRRYGLDYRHPPADDALLPVEAVDHGVGAVPLGLRREVEDDQPGDEAADGRERNSHPPHKRHAEEEDVRPARGKYEPDQVFHEKTRRGLEEEIENDGPEAGNDPYQDAYKRPAPDALDPSRMKCVAAAGHRHRVNLFSTGRPYAQPAGQACRPLSV